MIWILVDTRRGQEVGKIMCGVIVVLLVLGGLGVLWWLRYTRGYHLVVFRNAIVEIHQQTIIILPCNEIQAVWIEPVKIGNNVKVTSTRGVKMAFDSGISRPGEHLALIEKKMVTALLPEAESAIKSGKNVDFGPLILSREGLRQGEYLLPWQRMASLALAINAGTGRLELHVGQQDRMGSWCIHGTHTIPNLHLFFELVRRNRPDLIK